MGATKSSPEERVEAVLAYLSGDPRPWTRARADAVLRRVLADPEPASLCAEPRPLGDASHAACMKLRFDGGLAGGKAPR